MAKMDSVNMWKSGSSGSYENGVVPSGEKAPPTAEEELSAEGSASSSSADSQVGGGGSTSSTAAPTGPDPLKLKAILDRTSTRERESTKHLCVITSKHTSFPFLSFPLSQPQITPIK